MEKDIGKIKKNDNTDIVVRIDDFGGKPGLTIREYMTTEGYTGFTKKGTRIPAEDFEEFKKMINSINPEDLQGEQTNLPEKEKEDENSGVSEDGTM
ncbi:MAG: PC4/YdbC family ssDNA-binding protein [Candidatus Nanoarchaeia archaeon]